MGLVVFPEGLALDVNVLLKKEIYHNLSCVFI